MLLSKQIIIKEKLIFNKNLFQVFFGCSCPVKHCLTLVHLAKYENEIEYLAASTALYKIHHILTLPTLCHLEE